MSDRNKALAATIAYIIAILYIASRGMRNVNLTLIILMFAAAAIIVIGLFYALYSLILCGFEESGQDEDMTAGSDEHLQM